MLVSIFVFLVIASFGVIHIYAGYIGIEYYLGGFYAIVALFLALGMQFILPIIIGSFFCVINIWGWHWSLALLFVAPFCKSIISDFIEKYT